MSVPAHRLQPIYDALDNGNYKQSLTLCNKHLKKQPTENIASQALKALSLVRLENVEEAILVAESVKKSSPTDEHVLHSLSLVYRAINRNDLIAEIYANAWSQNPKNEEFAVLNFMGLARGFDFKPLQATAVKLLKQFKNDKYLFWNVMTLLMLDEVEKKKSGKSGLYLTLAERMIEKAEKEGKLTNFEVLQLFILILESAKKIPVAIDLVKSETGKKCCKVEVDRKRLLIDLIKEHDESASSSEINQLAKNLIEANPDDWLSYIDYIHSALKTITPESVEIVRTFLLSQQSLSESKKMKIRGPYLAELELDRIIQKSGELKITRNEIFERISSYYKRFGNVYCCFEDLKPYLHEINQDELELLHKMVGDIFTESEKKMKIEFHKRMTNFKKIERFLSFVDGVSNINRSKELVDHYFETLSLGENLLPTDRQHGDDYLLLAGHYLIDEFVTSGNSHILIHVLELMEFGLLKSIHNFQFKILAIRCYFRLGDSTRALQIAETLDIKYIQNDTLRYLRQIASDYINFVSYLITDDIEMLGNFDNVVFPLVKTLSIYSGNQREIPEMLVKAYQFESYSKIPEFMKFYEKVTNSLQRVITIRQTVRLELLRRVNGNVVDEYLRNLDFSVFQHGSEGYSDNRDLTVAAEFHSAKSVMKSLSIDGEFPKSRELWVKQREFLPKVLARFAAEKFEINEDLLKNVDHLRKTIDSKDDKDNELVVDIVLLSFDILKHNSEKKEFNVSISEEIIQKIEDFASQISADSFELNVFSMSLRKFTVLLELALVTSIMIRSFSRSSAPTKKQKKADSKTLVSIFEEKLKSQCTRISGIINLGLKRLEEYESIGKFNMELSVPWDSQLK
ncbi:N-alpha-acetyltransferase 25, NatB auxiliary subunit, partial [Nowakowskiella sp. JEL0078]